MREPAILPIDKPLGVRSTRCVELFRRFFGRDVKIGHGGTLDSSASGLLVLLVGGATRLSNLIMQMPKVYLATFQLGTETTTCDATGEAVAQADYSSLREADADEALPAFLGWRMQVPPDVSAVHVGGRRAHALFREGGKPEVSPRPVFVERIERTAPLVEGRLTLRIHCGKGTYVRSIARDIGRKLGCGAHVAALRRERIGPFAVNDAFAPDADLSNVEACEAHLLRPSSISAFLPAYALTDEQGAHMGNGRKIPFNGMKRFSFGQRCPDDRALFSADTLCSVAQLRFDHNPVLLEPETNIFLVSPPGGQSR
jgi:tRNA pseudouridine 55 synthase